MAHLLGNTVLNLTMVNYIAVCNIKCIYFLLKNLFYNLGGFQYKY